MNRTERAVSSVALAGLPPRLKTHGLSKVYQGSGRRGREVRVHAVVGANVLLGEAETLGIVGESGCGKSTLGRMLAGLVLPSEGSIELEGRLYEDQRSIHSGLRGSVQMVFQDPTSALDPRMRIVSSVGEAAAGPSKARRSVAREMLDVVGLSEDYLDRRPHQLSGGEQQRVCIARALVGGAKVVVLDEVVSALDPIFRAQILDLLLALQAEFGTSYLFISHDLHAVNAVSARVGVMYLGEVVETAPVETFRSGSLLHPYSVLLRSSVLSPTAGKARSRLKVAGEVPSPVSRPTGCPFHPRCPVAREHCKTEKPALVSAGSGHEVACHYPGELGIGV